MTTCRLCGGDSLALAYTQGNRREYHFYRCPRCALVNYDLSGGLDQGKYANASTVSARDDDARLNRGSTDTARFIRSLRPSPGRVLDVGCGNGRLLFQLERSGWRTAGLELTSALVTRARTDTDADVAEGNFLTYERTAWTGAFDVVVLRHVLEHLPDTLGALERLHRWLVPGGHAVLEFPNIDAWELRWKRSLERWGIRKRRYREGYVPGHCNEFCRESFAFAADRSGFELEHWSTYSNLPMKNVVYSRWPIGNKARAVARKV